MLFTCILGVVVEEDDVDATEVSSVAVLADSPVIACIEISTVLTNTTIVMTTKLRKYH